MCCVLVLPWVQVLAQRFSKVQGERDELYGRFEASIYEVAQKSGLKVGGCRYLYWI